MSLPQRPLLASPAGGQKCDSFKNHTGLFSFPIFHYTTRDSPPSPCSSLLSLHHQPQAVSLTCRFSNLHTHTIFFLFTLLPFLAISLIWIKIKPQRGFQWNFTFLQENFSTFYTLHSFCGYRQCESGRVEETRKRYPRYHFICTLP